jgi:hypothetical protein
MSLAPRVVVVSRATELAELVARHGTPAAAAFFLRTRGRDVDEVRARDAAQAAALATATAGIPLDWRRGSVERADLPRFLFAPDDVVLVVGQDGLVANVAKYLDGQTVIGVDPEPGRNPGVLVRHRADDVAALLRERRAPTPLTMVEAVTDDGQSLRALNEVYLGSPTHQTARWRLTAPGADPERQASSGLIVATGTGSTGWCRSGWLERPGRGAAGLVRPGGLAVPGHRHVEHRGGPRPGRRAAGDRGERPAGGLRRRTGGRPPRPLLRPDGHPAPGGGPSAARLTGVSGGRRPGSRRQG